MKVTVGQGKCASSGDCVLNLSEVVDQPDEDGVVVLLNADPPVAEEANVCRAVVTRPANRST